MSCSCNVCLEPYTRIVNPPYICNPCGHVTCKPCLDTWLTNNRKTCPECRTRITSTTLNRSLIDLIEQTDTTDTDTTDTTDTDTTDTTTNFDLDNEINIPKKSKNNYMRSGELLHDKCGYSIVVIDNSLSMENYRDGTIYNYSANRSIQVEKNVIRWREAVSKVLQIADYNIKRKITASYYLLNPVKYNKWEKNTDYIIINPNDMTIDDMNASISNLNMNILDRGNIRGNTPLDKVTCHLKPQFRQISSSINAPISYNIITDGEPNDKNLFEIQLRQLCQNYNIFLVINLCTDMDNVIDYYNHLDKKLNNELSGMDVLDDLESEAGEVWRAGNTFFTYSLDIHICRMAGCHSIIADWLDETELEPRYANLLLSQLTKFKGLSTNGFSNKYCDQVTKMNSLHPLVYNIRTRNFSPIINIFRLYLLQYIYPIKQRLGLSRFTVIEFVQIMLLVLGLLLMIFY